MSWFLAGIAFLIGGYLLYGRLVERLFAPDARPTPCVSSPDGVDRVPLPQWKNMLIQLLNIAGVGPVIGVILGIKFGKIALVIIPVGCIFMGAVHDFAAGMMSLRDNGANLPKIVRTYLGRGYATVFSWMMVVLLLLVVAVFINVPANLIDKTVLPSLSFFWWAVGIIFAYYAAATLFPVDKIIGRIYPFFGALLIVGTVAIFSSLLVAGFRDPDLLAECAGFAAFQKENPLFPCLFVTIACGIISGFHATQGPIVARTMTSERQARGTFFGMMVAEGLIALVWAAAALAIYNLFPEKIALPGAIVLGDITTHFLGRWMGGVTVFAIVVLAITSGDTALRSARLSVAELFNIDQVKLSSRVLTCAPLIVLVSLLLCWSHQNAKTFNNLWNYFAWGNQFLSVTTLMAATVWLLRAGRRDSALVTLVPGLFMTSVIVAFILWTPGTGGQPWGLVPGGLALSTSTWIAAAVSLLFAVWVVRRGCRSAS
jgi:carbon starvation protein CstA